VLNTRTERADNGASILGKRLFDKQADLNYVWLQAYLFNGPNVFLLSHCCSVNFNIRHSSEGRNPVVA